MENALSRASAERLARRPHLRVDPSRRIAVKRDVHHVEIEASAHAVAHGFDAAVTDPTTRFGPIRIRRPADRIGKPFVVGERFQGCFELPGRQVLGDRLARWIEDTFLSNYAEVTAIELDPDPGEPYRLEYSYLSGTPIAGRSVFTIEPLAPGLCRFTQVFEYQETDPVALLTFQRVGLKLHDEVVSEEARQAAHRAGGAVRSTTIPGNGGGCPQPLGCGKGRPTGPQGGGWAQKRNVHEVVVDVEPDRFAMALRGVLTEVDRFRSLRVERPADRRGEPWREGDRMESVATLPGWVPRWLASPLERRCLSERARVLELTDRRVVYEYMAGSPLTGRTELVVGDHPIGAALTATMEFREIGMLGAVLGIHAFGLRLHDAVVAEQARLAAERAGGRVVGSTIAIA